MFRAGTGTLDMFFFDLDLHISVVFKSGRGGLRTVRECFRCDFGALVNLISLGSGPSESFILCLAKPTISMCILVIGTQISHSVWELVACRVFSFWQLHAAVPAEPHQEIKIDKSGAHISGRQTPMCRNEGTFKP
jgi:hypothetical protein